MLTVSCDNTAQANNVNAFFTLGGMLKDYFVYLFCIIHGTLGIACLLMKTFSLHKKLFAGEAASHFLLGNMAQDTLWSCFSW